MPVVIAWICKVWSSGWIAALAACVAYMAAERAAKSADMPPPTLATGASDIPRALPVPGDAPGSQFEARLGVFAAGVGSVEQGTADLNGSFLTPRLNVGAPGYLAYFLPRFQLGGAVNLSGRTSFAYFDGALTLPITQRLFLRAIRRRRHTYAVSPRRRPCRALAVRLVFLLLSIGASVAPTNAIPPTVGLFPISRSL